MNKKSTSLTITDIARTAGVSTATVSRVINETGFVSDPIRERVQQVIDNLGFKPQRIHKKEENRLWIAVLTDSAINAFFAQILSSIQEQAAERELYAFVVQMPANAKRKVDLFKQLKRKPWAGIISAGFYMSAEDWIKLYDEIQTPLVIMNTKVDHPHISSLRINFEGATINAIQHLLQMGHSRIAYLGDFTNEFSAAEFRGVEIALTQHGYKYPDEYRFSVPHTPEGASQGINRIMDLPLESRPTAILTFDDEFAVHVLNALHFYRVNVPEDISVIGFDNIPMAAHTYPPLTTIDLPKYRIGRQLVTLLQQLIENNGEGLIGQVTIDGSLVVRKSTGPAPNI